MTLQVLDLGTTANDGQGDPLRTAGNKTNDNFAELYAGGFTAAVDVAAAATCDIGSAASPFVNITGTTTITSFGTVASRLRLIRFAGALTLTNGAALALPGAANITTAAGDTAVAGSDASGNWRVYSYVKASGKSVVAPAVADLTDGAWTTWTPTVSSEGGAVTGATVTVTAKYKQVGKILCWRIHCVVTSKGSGSPTGAVRFSLPSGLGPLNSNNPGSAYYVNTGGLASVNASSDGRAYAYKADATTLWVDGNVFTLSGNYEVA